MSDQVNFTRYLAYLDTLHDFCGSRNKLIPIQNMRNFVGLAFGYKSEHDAIATITNIIRTDALRKQAADLFYYRSGKFNTFEQNVVDFVMSLSRNLSGDMENVVEINIKKNASSDVLSSLIPPHVIYDTSVLSYDYICNTLKNKISVTMATNWDGDGTNINIPAPCKDNQTTTLTFGLQNKEGETSTLQEIGIERNNIYTIYSKKKESIKWEQIQEELNGVMNVKSYVGNIKDFSSIKSLFRKLLQIEPGQEKNYIDIIGRITDVKRSGDWLQLEAMKTLKTQSPIHKDMILYTVDTPLAARTLSTNETAIVTYAPPGRGEINVRLIGNTKLTPVMLKEKQAELQFYRSIIKSSWLSGKLSTNSGSDIVSMDDILSKLSTLIYKTVNDRWREKKVLMSNLADAENLRVDDLRNMMFSANDFLRQKHIQILVFLMYMYVLLRHLDKNKTKHSFKHSLETTSTDSQQLLKDIRVIKTYVTEELQIPSMDLIRILDFSVLKKDINALKTLIDTIPSSFSSEMIKIVSHFVPKSDTPITNYVYYMMKEIVDLQDLSNKHERNPKYTIQGSEARYRKYAAAVQSVQTDVKYYSNGIYHIDKHFMYMKSFKNKTDELANLVKKTMKGGARADQKYNQLFDISVASGHYYLVFLLYNIFIDRSAFTFELQNVPDIPTRPRTRVSRSGIAHVPYVKLLEDSPFMQDYFASFPISVTGMLSIPVAEYMFAMLLRDMFLQRPSLVSHHNPKFSPPTKPAPTTMRIGMAQRRQGELPEAVKKAATKKQPTIIGVSHQSRVKQPRNGPMPVVTTIAVATTKKDAATRTGAVKGGKKKSQK